jgi:hypothetical protein
MLFQSSDTNDADNTLIAKSIDLLLYWNLVFKYVP